MACGGIHIPTGVTRDYRLATPTRAVRRPRPKSDVPNAELGLEEPTVSSEIVDAFTRRATPGPSLAITQDTTCRMPVELPGGHVSNPSQDGDPGRERQS
jgi:hypothetical protein